MTCLRCSQFIPDGRGRYYLKLGPWCRDCLGNALQTAESYHETDQMAHRGRVLLALRRTR